MICPELIQAQLPIIGKLMLATLAGGVLGYFRRKKGTGIRTLSLITLGAAIFTIASAYGFRGADPSRIAAGIVTGIGFLGAGVIWKHKHAVKGITTAATIWSAAAIGIISALGMWLITIIVLILIIVILDSKYIYDLDHKDGIDANSK